MHAPAVQRVALALALVFACNAIYLFTRALQRESSPHPVTAVHVVLCVAALVFALAIHHATW